MVITRPRDVCRSEAKHQRVKRRETRTDSSHAKKSKGTSEGRGARYLPPSRWETNEKRSETHRLLIVHGRVRPRLFTRDGRIPLDEGAHLLPLELDPER